VLFFARLWSGPSRRLARHRRRGAADPALGLDRDLLRGRSPLGRDGVLAGSQVLTTITNDAWFGRSSAPWQHFAMASC
jgi:apolipoprotein N-acyltransferase